MLAAGPAGRAGVRGAETRPTRRSCERSSLLAAPLPLGLRSHRAGAADELTARVIGPRPLRGGATRAAGQWARAAGSRGEGRARASPAAPSPPVPVVRSGRPSGGSTFPAPSTHTRGRGGGCQPALGDLERPTPPVRSERNAEARTELCVQPCGKRSLSTYWVPDSGQAAATSQTGKNSEIIVKFTFKTNELFILLRRTMARKCVCRGATAGPASGTGRPGRLPPGADNTPLRSVPTGAAHVWAELGQRSSLPEDPESSGGKWRETHL
ncbi:uncharacterized protein LOC128580861 [Nycticebus coucang]|uniref:uncharacterized protein LOC128580861 n=1 Tax=Nycticebus coucang TaxID=9470 RepID=UPI00234C22CD|nr:uncharacterized protein LOC128580861 [Nycticebus coucang]